MTWLAFEIERLRPLWEHARAAPHREPTFPDRCMVAEKLGLADDEYGSSLTQEQFDEHLEPSLWIVKDNGIYLMSNGLPRLMDPVKQRSPNGLHEMEVCQVVYARGFDPRTDPGVWERSRDAVGGDDFGETLPADFVAKAFEAEGAKHLRVRFKGVDFCQMEMDIIR